MVVTLFLLPPLPFLGGSPTARADSKLPFQLQRSSSLRRSDMPELDPE